MADIVGIDARPGALSLGLSPYRRGWAAVGGGAVMPHPPHWERLACGPFQVFVDPTQPRVAAGDDQTRLLLIGTALDTSAGVSDQARIGQQLLRSAQQGERTLVRHVAYLGGRFVLLAARGDEVIVVPDAAATIPAYWKSIGPKVWLSSHSALVAEGADLPLDEDLLHLMAETRATSRYVVFPPGARTPHVGVRPLLSNHLLRWRTTEMRHERFYPFDETALPSSGYERFRHHFTEHVRLIAHGRPLDISLTAGMDSRATFAALARVVHPSVSAWSWRKDHDPHPDELLDVADARSRAERAGVVHRIIRITPEETPDVRAAFERTFPAGMQERALAASAVRQIAPPTITAMSMIAEAGTGFYRFRSDEPPSATRLARIYSNRPIGESDYAVEAFDEFISYANFRPEHFGPWDHHDLQYWEHRLPLWATLRMQELELSHQIEQPFNSRHIIEALASLPWEVRRRKPFQRAYELGY